MLGRRAGSCVLLLTLSACGQSHESGEEGCEHRGERYEVGSTFPAGDGCNTCTCAPDGDVSCTLALCPRDGGTDRWMPEAGPREGGVDGPEGPGTCYIGQACEPARGCAEGECIGETHTTLGSAEDPVEGHPDGDEAIPVTYWEDGYCIPRVSGDPSGESCDLEDPSSCGECASCTPLGGGATGCLRDCTPSGTDNGDCRDGYACSLSFEVCIPGCSSDEACRVSRMDTNGDGEIDAETGDALVYDTGSDATCNTETWRCEHSGTTGAVAGDPCEKDSQCEADGTCIAEADRDPWALGAFPGGYCTKLRCDLTGRECAGSESVCQERVVGRPSCLAGCTVGASDSEWTEGDFASYVGVNGDCRDGYACRWNGVDGAAVSGNGGCLPGEFNDVTTPNVGAACSDDAECHSPFGLGACLSGESWEDTPMCTVLDCGAPGLPSDVCGPDAQCLDADGAAGDLTWCLAECESAEDCRAGLGCVDYDGMLDTPKVCFPGCLGDDDCRAEEECDIPAGMMVGSCI